MHTSLCAVVLLLNNYVVLVSVCQPGGKYGQKCGFFVDKMFVNLHVAIHGITLCMIGCKTINHLVDEQTK